METARNFYDNLPPPTECLAILVGCAQLTVFGLGALANPIEYSKGHGLPITLASTNTKRQVSEEEGESANEAQKNQIALVSAMAARNIGNGILILSLACYFRDRRALGVAVAANAFSALADTFIVKSFGTEDKASTHITGIIASLGIGSTLLYWRREDPWW